MKGSGIEWGDIPAPVFVMDEPGEFWVGRVVSRVRGTQDFGHIVGFARSKSDKPELILRVVWSNSEETTIHPSNLNLH